MKSKLYTRTGDSGTTSLVDGRRVRKNDPRIEAYGTVDELNSQIGVLIGAQPLEETDRMMLTQVQRSLFSIGAYLAAGDPAMAAKLLPELDEPMLILEGEIDRLDAVLSKLEKFVLPQGTQACAHAHVARTVARRAERRILDLDDVDASVLGYVNRLSDYLFVLARHSNRLASVTETYW